jgi:hypothetical protein
MSTPKYTPLIRSNFAPNSGFTAEVWADEQKVLSFKVEPANSLFSTTYMLKDFDLMPEYKSKLHSNSFFAPIAETIMKQLIIVLKSLYKGTVELTCLNNSHGERLLLMYYVNSVSMYVEQTKFGTDHLTVVLNL